MDLKLKDEVTKLLIEKPGLSISELAKKTDNYYSYTHKVVSEMEEADLVSISKVKRGKKYVTVCNLTSDYQREWVMDVKRLIHSLLKNAEIKAALLVMYGFILIQLFMPTEPSLMISTETLSVDRVANQSLMINWELVIAVLIPLLLVLNLVRKLKLFKKKH